jgi:hypothetical protein
LETNTKELQEGQTGVIELPVDDDADAVKAMVEFFYTGDYECPGQNPFDITTPAPALPKPKSKSFKKAARVYDEDGTLRSRVSQLTTPPGVPQTLPTSNFTFELSNNQKHPLLFHLAVYEVADRIQQADLKALAESKFERTAQGTWLHLHFLDAVRKVYEIAPPGTQGDRLRKIVLKVTAEHTKEIFATVGFADMLREVHDFSADLNAALCGHESLNYNQVNSLGMETFKCRVCDSSFTIKIPLGLQSMTCPVCKAGISLEEWRGISLDGWL